jgi:DNA polymerase-3 subunit delta'
MTLFGYEDKIRSFKRLIKEDRLGQSYLFYGDEGIGKNSFAKLLACALETGKFETTPETLLDVSFVAKDEEENSLGIEKVLELKRFLWQSPLKSRYRLAVVNDAEELTPEAQGALLKIVEEPPAHGLIVFIAHDENVLLPPLASRLTKIYFPRLSKAEITGILKEHYGAAKGKAEETAELSFGRLGLALRILDGKKEKKEESLEDILENKILKLRREGLRKNAKTLAWLLDREMSVKRYNLNMNLQKKAVEQWI